jgi:acyl-CoA hydrolase
MASGQPISASRTEMIEVVLPQDANVLGSALGGRVMHFVDMVGAIVAMRHCRSAVVTASVDHIDFRSPVQVGELMILKSSVNRAFRTSLEVGVKVFSEHPLTGERRHTTSAYLTFVALDEDRQPKPVPEAICETAEDRRRYREALVRRKRRLSGRGE